MSSAIEDNCPLCEVGPAPVGQAAVDLLREQANDLLRQAHDLQQRINAAARPDEPVVEPGEVVTVTFVRNMLTGVGSHARSRQVTFAALGWIDEHGDTAWSVSGSTDPGQSRSWDQLLSFMGSRAWTTIRQCR